MKTQKFFGIKSIGKAVLSFITLGFASSLFALDPPSWVATNSNNAWTPQLGGGVWYQEGIVVSNITPAIEEYPRPVLLSLA
ncbi:MAG TPA: hypothetical protein VG077_18285 [Verrucomicrobiae bacterium]|nr:hypothetical protein [Verrucomicrobiae bacterium]